MRITGNVCKMTKEVRIICLFFNKFFYKYYKLLQFFTIHTQLPLGPGLYVLASERARPRSRDAQGRLRTDCTFIQLVVAVSPHQGIPVLHRFL